jgi:hypothetical protein
MRIAIVVPFLHKLAGNRLAIDIAEALQKAGNTVYLLSELASEEVKNYISSTNLSNRFLFRYIYDGNISSFHYALRRFSRRRDRKLLTLIKSISKDGQFDVVLVFANEGHYIGRLLKKHQSSNHILSVLVVMELIEYPFILNKTPKVKFLKAFFTPILPFLHLSELQNMSSFDVILSNSDWTSIMTETFYGILPMMCVASVNTEKFNSQFEGPDKKYIALPTASLKGSDIQMVKRLKEDGIEFISFGPYSIHGIKYMGYVDELELRQIYANAMATLFLFDYEALGLPVLESLASGTPVITIPKQGPYLTLSGNPFVYFENSYDSLLKKCKEILSLGKTAEIVRSCKDSVSHFSSQFVAMKLLKLFSSQIQSANSDQDLGSP